MNIYNTARRTEYMKTVSKGLLFIFLLVQIVPTFVFHVLAEDVLDNATSSLTITSDSSELILTSSPSPSTDEISSNTFLDPESHNVISLSPATTTATSSESNASSTPTLIVSDVVASSSEPLPLLNTESIETLTSTSTEETSEELLMSTTTPSVFETSSTETISTTSTTTASSTSHNDLPHGTTTIATGNAAALANLINIVNTNLVNSTGSIVLANLTSGDEGDIDFRTSTTSEATSTCTLLSCNGVESIEANIHASTSIDNTIDLNATTGENTIETTGHGIIETGQAFTGLNLVNVANSNLIDSNYLLVSLNSFTDVNGDIVFPSLTHFFNPQAIPTYEGSLDTHQTGTITNNLNVDAHTGENEIFETNTATTTTGAALSSTTLYNSLNKNLTGGGSVHILLKVTGTWFGELFGAPQGVEFDNEGNTKILSLERGGIAAETKHLIADITSTSTALINNDIDLLSETGLNEISDVNTANIKTGAAVAAANVVNIANTNIVGRNWILAIINIFGNFNGNIAFGRPDLWLGEQVQGEAVVQNGSTLTYTITVANRGDSSATHAVVTSSYDTAHLDIIDSTLPYSEQDGKISFMLGTIEPTDSREIIFRAQIKNAPQGTQITNTSTVTERETDNNIADNTDSTTISTYVESTIPQGGSGSNGNNGNTHTGNNGTTLPAATIPLVIAVQRITSSSTVIGTGVKNEQVIIIKNLSGENLHNTSFEDILVDPTGREIQREIWDLETLRPYEEVTITYDVVFGARAENGTYLFSSELHHSPNKSYTFTSNGYLTYVKKERTSATLPSSPVTPTTLSQERTQSPRAISSTNTSTLQRTPSSTPENKPQQGGSILGAFTQALSPEIAYAEDMDSAVRDIDWNYWLAYLIILLLVVAAHMYRRHLSRNPDEN